MPHGPDVRASGRRTNAIADRELHVADALPHRAGEVVVAWGAYRFTRGDAPVRGRMLPVRKGNPQRAGFPSELVSPSLS